MTRFYIRVHPQSLFYISVTVITFSNRRIIASFCLRARRRYPLVHVLTKKINWTNWRGKPKPDWGRKNNLNKLLNKWLTLDWVFSFFRAVLYFSASSNALFNLKQQKKMSQDKEAYFLDPFYEVQILQRGSSLFRNYEVSQGLFSLLCHHYFLQFQKKNS